MPAVVLALAAVICWPASPPAGVRLARISRPPRPALRSRTRSPAALVAAGVIGLGALAFVAPIAGVSAVPVVGLLLRRRQSSHLRRPELPLVADLLAGCLAAGAGLPAALSAAAAAAGPDLRPALDSAAAALAAGDPPADACRHWADDRQLRPLARTLIRSAESGSSAGADVSRFADRLRAETAVALRERIARVSVWAVVPVGLCFLPAFVLVGVVPVAVGLLAGLR